jgi:hypothetical protein
MTDFVTSAVPPLIPGDVQVSDAVANVRVKAVESLVLPVIVADSTVPSIAVAEGMLMFNTGIAKLQLYGSGAWHVVTSV